MKRKTKSFKKTLTKTKKYITDEVIRVRKLITDLKKKTRKNK